MRRKYVLLSILIVGLGLTLNIAGCAGQIENVKLSKELADGTKAEAAVNTTAPETRITGTPMPIPHSLVIRHECLLCHGQKGDTDIPYPDSHIGTPEDKCLQCHKMAENAYSTADTGAATGIVAGEITRNTAAAAKPAGIPVIPHSLDGRNDCLMCHQAGIGGAPKVPADHAGRTNVTCLGCHKQTG